jgi:hypothetical protein
MDKLTLYSYLRLSLAKKYLSLSAVADCLLDSKLS